MSIHIGTSGWHYPHWVERFYPTELRSQSPAVLTASLTYVRLHRPHQAYTGSYTQRQLVAWAERLRAWDGEGQEVYVFFDNDQQACAVHDALALQQQLSG